MDNHYTPFSPQLLTHTQRLLLKYDASAVLSEHLMSKSTVFVEIYNRAARRWERGGSGGRLEKESVVGV